MRVLLWFFLPLLLCSSKSRAESFISEYEYGQMLYENPRGVSCVECHGYQGEGRSIVRYQDTHGTHELRGSDIRKSTLLQMIKSLNSYHDIMPRYYLTDKEIEAIYNYIQKRAQAKREKEDK